MSLGLLCGQALEAVRIWQHLASLLDQRGEAACDLFLVGNTHAEYLLSFRPGWNATQGRQPNGDAVSVLDLTNSVMLAQPKQRFDGIRTDRQPDFLQTELCGNVELLVKVGLEAMAHTHRRDRLDKRRALRQRAVAEALGFENLLALEQRDGIGLKPFDKWSARG